MNNSYLAKRLKKINPSSTLAITSKAKKLKSEGYEVVNFAAGEPDFDTPDFIKEAAIKAIKEGFTKYTPTTGIPELKKAIVEKFKQDNRIEYNPEAIIVSCGAKQSIFNILMTLVDFDDEVIIPSPYWVSYPEMVNLCGGRPIFLETKPENNFKLRPKDLEKIISPKTKVLILNSPGNPSGCVYEELELKEIALICAKKKIFVISDEIYEKLIYDNKKHISIASLGKDIYEITFTVNGVSKAYAMTGWRIGYAAGPQEIIEAMAKLQDHSTSNPTSISQKAALAALLKVDENFSEKMRLEFQRRRDYALARLIKMKKINFVKPQGAFYIFCDIAKTKLDSLTFASRLLEEEKVAVIPGKGFGRDDYIRISFATSLEEIEKGMDRLEKWLTKI